MSYLESSRAETLRTVDYGPRQLDLADRQWTERLGMRWSDEPGWLESLNGLVEIGDIYIGPGTDPAMTQAIVEARRRFLELMTRVLPETVTAFETMNRTFMPTGTIIETQRTLAARGIDGLSVNDFPGLFSYAPGGITQKLDTLESLLPDVPAAVKKYPSILAYNTSTLRHKFDAIEAIGVGAASVVQRYPRVLMVTDEQLAERSATFSKHGLDPAHAVDTLPSLMTILPETVDKKVDDLRSLGLRPAAYKLNPMLLGYATDSVRAKLELYDELGLNGAALVNRLPKIANYSPAAVRSKVANIRSNGLDPQIMISKNPNVLYLSEQRFTQKLDRLIDLGITATAIERGPTVLNVSELNLRDTLAGMRDMGLDVPGVVNSQPSLLHLTLANLAEKLAFLQSKGFDAVRLANTKASILCLTPETVSEKLRICIAAARAWQWEDPTGQVIRLIGEWPMILTYSPAKLRTTVRLANDALASRGANDVKGTDVSSMITVNLEQAVTAYLEQPGDISEPKDIKRLAKRYSTIGKQALQTDIVIANDNTVARTYARSHRIK